MKLYSRAQNKRLPHRLLFFGNSSHPRAAIIFIALRYSQVFCHNDEAWLVNIIMYRNKSRNVKLLMQNNKITNLQLKFNRWVKRYDFY